MPQPPLLLTTDTLLTRDQVARALKWKDAECFAWLRGLTIGRRLPNGRLRYRWGDVLERIPMEEERDLEPDKAVAFKKASWGRR